MHKGLGPCRCEHTLDRFTHGYRRGCPCSASHFCSLFAPGTEGHSTRLHLCEDRESYQRRSVYDGCKYLDLRAAFAFQRHVIHYVMPRIRSYIVHCHHWMTCLVPAAALAHIEDRVIDSAGFWSHLYFNRYSYSYEDTRDHNNVSMLNSGILPADRMNTVSPSFSL